VFELDEHMRQWRRTMSQRLPGQDEAIDELESHLREAFERLTVGGASPDEAWQTALAQLGSAEQLAAEFHKLPAVAFHRWLPARVLLIMHAALALWLGWGIFSGILGRRPDPLLALHVFILTVGYTAVFAVGAIAAWSIMARAFYGWTERENAALCSAVRWWSSGGLALTALGIVLGSCWARGHMGRFWGWDLREISALVILLWNGLVLGLLARHSPNERLVMLLGQAGNVVVALGWFVGPILLAAALHDYEHVSAALLSAPILAFMLIELAFAGLTFVPPGRLRLNISGD
jgi:hypothetical protein